MKNSIAKLALLDQLENVVESHLRFVTSSVQNLPIEMLLKPSTTGGWSIAQCLAHLNGYGNFYLPLFRDGLANQKGKPSSDMFKSTWLGRYFTKMMHPDTGKKKYKAFKDHIPDCNLDARSVIATFIEQQEMLLSLLTEARTADLNAIRIPLSISRWVTFKLGDAFQFLVAHNERHIQQAKRNIL